MIETFIHCPRILQRIRRNYLAEYIELLAVHLKEQSYVPSTAVRYLRVAESFGDWLQENGIAVHEADEPTAKQFLTQFKPRVVLPRVANPADRYCEIAGIMRLLEIMGSVSIARRRDRKQTPAQQSVSEFINHLGECCGLAKGTIANNERHIREFLLHHFGDGKMRLAALRPQNIMSYIAAKARVLAPGTVHGITCSLRSYFRFLQFKGYRVDALVTSIPRVPGRKLATVPAVLTEAQVRDLLGCFDRTTPSGRRDYAMAVCMLDLGIRPSDVAALTLDDIDWRSGTIRVANVKMRHSYSLPLPERVGQTLAGYLRHDRPASGSRQLFLRHRAPCHVPLTCTIVKDAMQRVYKRFGLPPQWKGFHLLRHTAATRMHCRGATLKQVADILGHRSIETTAIYTKVNLPLLATVPLAWPEVRS